MKRFWLVMFFIMITTSVCYAKVDVPETVRIKLNDDSIIELDLDEYLYGVVASEMGTSYSDNGVSKKVDIEALKAQAVASRSYATYNINSRVYNDYDMTATTADQVYRSGKVADIVKEAVDSTSGQVLTYDGKIISAYFFSTSGGHTESSENVWYTALPYLVGVEDPYEPYIKGLSEWEARIPADKYGKIKILEVDENDRVISLRVGDKVLNKNAIRMTLGASLIKSTWFDVEYDKSTDEYVFIGKGFGHGVGMSQHGAMGMAEEGFDYEEILKWYYTGVELANVPNKTSSSRDKKKEEIDKTNVIEKDYSNTTPTEVSTGKNKKEKEKGPMLMGILNLIHSNVSFINSNV